LRAFLTVYKAPTLTRHAVYPPTAAFSQGTLMVRS
jgi:hypothetical protein